ncbi:MAG: phosphoribosyl-AMP cyclohydrolase [Deltaproteobacteria bacterium]|nr:phosphoribosyl-AMP cyclohydrolase [Deltaproteobacteria bacterium]
MNTQVVDQLKYDDKGLIPAIAQDYQTGEVLMVAYMNRESLAKTLESKIATYWSRSRGKLWIKGESSGHTQEVQTIYFDCDKDCVLMKVKQNVAACHVGYRSCFFYKLEGDQLVEVGEKVFEEDKVYS